MDESPRPPTTADASPRRPEDDEPTMPRQIASAVLFGGARELAIDHEGRTYRLRITRNGKLILTA